MKVRRGFWFDEGFISEGSVCVSPHLIFYYAWKRETPKCDVFMY